MRKKNTETFSDDPLIKAPYKSLLIGDLSWTISKDAQACSSQQQYTKVLDNISAHKGRFYLIIGANKECGSKFQKNFHFYDE